MLALRQLSSPAYLDTETAKPGTKARVAGPGLVPSANCSLVLAEPAGAELWK